MRISFSMGFGVVSCIIRFHCFFLQRRSEKKNVYKKATSLSLKFKTVNPHFFCHSSLYIYSHSLVNQNMYSKKNCSLLQHVPLYILKERMLTNYSGSYIIWFYFYNLICILYVRCIILCEKQRNKNAAFLCFFLSMPHGGTHLVDDTLETLYLGLPADGEHLILYTLASDLKGILNIKKVYSNTVAKF